MCIGAPPICKSTPWSIVQSQGVDLAGRDNRPQSRRLVGGAFADYCFRWWLICPSRNAGRASLCRLSAGRERSRRKREKRRTRATRERSEPRRLIQARLQLPLSLSARESEVLSRAQHGSLIARFRVCGHKDGRLEI